MITTNSSSMAHYGYAQSEKGKTFAFCFTPLHSASTGPSSQPQGSIFGCYIRDNKMKRILPSACLRWEMNPVPCKQMAGRRSCTLAGWEACSQLNPKH